MALRKYVKVKARCQVVSFSGYAVITKPSQNWMDYWLFSCWEDDAIAVNRYVNHDALVSMYDEVIRYVWSSSESMRAAAAADVQLSTPAARW